MNKFSVITRAWSEGFRESSSRSPDFQRLLAAQITVDHYKGILKQIFHNVRENPQIQMLAAVYFRGKQRELVKAFSRHSMSEIGHDQLAMNDLRALGEDVSMLPYERPLPATTALLAFPFYQIQHHNPVGYLGYLFHLEFMPTQHGKEYADVLSRLGVPANARTFLEEHVAVDVAHNKLMERYIESLVVSRDDLESVIYAARVTAHLYVNMVGEAIRHTDNPRRPELSLAEMTGAEDRQVGYQQGSAEAGLPQ